MIVPRISCDETTFAVIEWAGVPKDEVLSRIRKAVTKWSQATDDGRIAVANNNGDFKLGDLANESSSSDLWGFVRAEGFAYFKMECYCDDQPTRWEFDDCLISDD